MLDVAGADPLSEVVDLNTQQHIGIDRWELSDLHYLDQVPLEHSFASMANHLHQEASLHSRHGRVEGHSSRFSVSDFLRRMCFQDGSSV
jgi:hypothetical protein